MLNCHGLLKFIKYISLYLMAFHKNAQSRIHTCVYNKSNIIYMPTLHIYAYILYIYNVRKVEF